MPRWGLPNQVARVCTWEGCNKKHEAKGFCRYHYRQWRRKKDGPDWDNYKAYSKGWRRTLSGRYSTLKNSAKCRKLEFCISIEELDSVTRSPCVYCGVVISEVSETGYGLDRKDSSRGYTLDNVVPCCYTCNRIKMDILTYEEMKVAMEAVLEYRRKRISTIL